MIVDTSALLSIVLQEPDAPVMTRAILSAPIARLCSASYVEAALRVEPFRDSLLSRMIDVSVEELGLQVMPLTYLHARIARDAFLRYGKGMGSPAQLNFGDCLVYALAKETGEPLLFKGGDFGRTDLTPALPA